MVDPFNIIAVDDIGLLTKSKVECVLATEKDVQVESQATFKSSTGEVIRARVLRLQPQSASLEIFDTGLVLDWR